MALDFNFGAMALCFIIGEIALNFKFGAMNSHQCVDGRLFTSPKIKLGCTSPKINLGCTSPKMNLGCTSPKKMLHICCMARSLRSLRQVGRPSNFEAWPYGTSLRFSPAFRALGVCEHSWLGEIENFILKIFERTSFRSACVSQSDCRELYSAKYFFLWISEILLDDENIILFFRTCDPTPCRCAKVKLFCSSREGEQTACRCNKGKLFCS